MAVIMRREPHNFNSKTGNPTKKILVKFCFYKENGKNRFITSKKFVDTIWCQSIISFFFKQNFSARQRVKNKFTHASIPMTDGIC